GGGGAARAALVDSRTGAGGGWPPPFLAGGRGGATRVDARGAPRLYRSRISAAALLILVLAAFAAIGAALVVSDAGRTYLDLFADKWDKFLDWVQGLFS